MLCRLHRGEGTARKGVGKTELYENEGARVDLTVVDVHGPRHETPDPGSYPNPVGSPIRFTHLHPRSLTTRLPLSTVPGTTLSRLHRLKRVPPGS